jgi:hypothetical protein
MQGEQLGRRTLAIDAGFCAATGGLIMVLSRPFAFLIAWPRSFVKACGALLIARATFVGVTSRRPNWRPSTATMVAVNLAKGLSLGFLATRRRRGHKRILAGLLAIAFTALGVAQLQALRGPDA